MGKHVIDVCIYHSVDLDGECSAAIVVKKFPDVKLMPYNYGQDFDLSEVEGKNVIMVDLGFQPFHRMTRLYEVAESLVWVDHHKSNVTEFERYGLRDAKVILDTTKAACELTWEYMYPGIRTPRGVYLLGRYDVWDHEDPESIPFQYGMRAIQSSPKEDIWRWVLSESSIDRVVNAGKDIVPYQKKKDDEYAKAYSFVVKFEGLRVIACNIGHSGSQLFDSVYDVEKHDAMMSFCMTNSQKYAVSLYSTKPSVDVSEIAKKYGGGGHRGASGFQCDSLPFKSGE